MRPGFRWRGSLRTQLILAVAGVHALLMTMFVWDVTHRQQQLLLQQQSSKAEAVARSMATSSASWLFANDVSGLQEMAVVQRRHPDLVYAMLLDPAGAVLAHTDTTRLGQFVRDLPPDTDRTVIRRSARLLDVTTAVRMQGRLVGWARVGFSQRVVAARLAHLQRAGLAYATVAIAIGSALAWMLGTWVTGGLYAIRRVSSAVRGGGRDERVPELGGNEVGELAHDFNDMLDALAERDERRREAETALIESERQSRATFDLAAVGIAHVAPDGRWLRANRRMSEILGYSADELLGGLTFRDITHPDDLPSSVEPMRRCLAGEIDSYSVEKRYLSRDGREVWANLSMAPVRSPDGTAEYLIAVVEEIGARKRAELGLRESEQRVRLLLDSTAEGIYGVNLEQVCTFINRAGLRLLGYEREDEVLGRDLHGLAHHTRADGTPYPIAECRIRADAGDAEGIHVTDEVFWRRDGTCFPVEYRAYPMERGGRLVGTVVSFSDITQQLRVVAERELLEAQLRQAQKMEAVGQFAGGVAHDFNNMLTAILGNASLLQMTVPMNAEQGEWLGQIRDAGERAASLTQRLLTFSRRQRFEFREIDLNDVVRGMRDMLARLLGESVTLEVDLAPTPLVVRADPSMLEQVLMNLAVNARDAVEAGGRFTIATRAIEVPPDAPRTSPKARPGPAVLLSVADNGRGIPPEHLSRIFEPFFTTKEVGKGTGLGLSIVHGIVEQHGGWIGVESRAGRGTTFRIHLPSQPGTAPAEPDARLATSATRGHEAILLAEDEPSVRTLARTALERAGYRVFEANDGPAALEVWSRHRDEIELALVDMVMPGGLTGADLARALRRDAPGLPVLFCSGYTREGMSPDSIPGRGTSFIAKPYPITRLLTAVRDLLDARVRPPRAVADTPA